MKLLIISILLVLSCFRLFSSEPTGIKFEYITVENGISQGIIEDIFQDRQGYMWFATRDGLNRYDGINFQVFRNDRNNPQSLASNWVLSLAEDSSGFIWIGSDGLNKYDPVMNKMFRIPVNEKDPAAFHGGRVNSINIDYDGSLWLSTTNGLVHYFPGTDSFKTYVNQPDQSASLGNNNVHHVCISSNGRIYIAVNSDPIYEFNRKDETFKEINYKIAYFGSNDHKYIKEDAKGSLYITSEFSALHIYEPSTGHTKLLDKTEGGLSSASIKTIPLMVSPDEIWIGTDGGGINIYNPVTGMVKYLMMDTRNNSSISSNAIFRIYEDRDKNIWVGHFGSGVSVWKRNKEKFTSYQHNPFNPASINREVVTAIFEDSKGRIWVGQDGGGLSLFDESSGSFTHYRYTAGKPGSLTTDIVLAINEDPEGNLLLGTYSGGLMVFNPESGKVIRSYHVNDGMLSEHIWSILIDSKSRYWLSMLGVGYCLYDPVLNTFENYYPGDNGIEAFSNVIMHMTEGPDGKIWQTSENNGMCVIDYDKKSRKIYRHDENDRNSLSYNDVKSVIFIGDYAWIATNGGGLNRLDLKSDSFHVYTMEDGLSSNALMGMLKDDRDNLWISSTRGLMRFDTRTEKLVVYDKSQGIQGNEFKYNAQFRLKDGRMLFGGVNGLTLFHPDSIKSSGIIPKVVFNDFLIFNQSVVPGVKGSPLKKSINYTSFIRLRHKYSSFTLEFAALDYNSPEKNKYKYKLEGFDEDWIDAGNRRFATYTNLDAGRYTFMLKGSNSDGIWNEDVRKITIRVMRAWYASIIAKIIYLALLLYGIMAYIRKREENSRKDKLILNQKIDDAREELKIKTRRVEEQEAEIKQNQEKDKDIRFYIEGIARVSEIIASKRKNLNELTTAIIAELVEYVGASAGCIFIADDSNPEQISLKLSGSYCLSDNSDKHSNFLPGEGNVGTCYLDKQSHIITNLPDNYLVLKSGLGSISLKHAQYIPILQENICNGVIETCSVEKLSENVIHYMEKVAESLAAVIAIIRANEKSSLMIEQNNTQAEELKAQEDALKQNMEELMATQEENQRKENDMLNELAANRLKIEELEKELAKYKTKRKPTS